MKTITRLLSYVLLCAPLAGCAQPSSTTDDEHVASAESALRIGVNPRALSYDYAHIDQLPAGVAGGREVVFIGSPLQGRVVARGRLSGAEIGDLPPPPGGFALPFIMHSIGPDKVAVLDAGGLPQPSPLVPANPTIYEYTYSYSPQAGFTATLSRTVSFSSVLIGFAEDFAVLDGGRYALSDAVLGAIWVAEADGTIRAGIAPKSDQACDAIPEMKFCGNMPTVQVGGLPFLFSGSAIPGVGTLAARNDELFFYSSCAGALYKVPVASLSDKRAPYARAADIRMVSQKAPGVAVEEIIGASFNTYDPDDRNLYAADALQLRVVRIDTKTGKRQVIGDDPTLFNFPSSTAFLPPIAGVSPLVVVSNQQHRTPLTNDAVSQDMFVPPFIVAKVYLLPGEH